MKLGRASLQLIVLGLMILLLGLAPYPREFSETMRQAEVHRLAREYEAALQAYREAAQLSPSSPLPWRKMGEILLLQQRFIPATAVLLEAQHLGESAETWRLLGESYAGRADWAGAMQSWLRAQALAPDDAQIYVALGRGSIAQGQFDQAAGFLTQALALEASPQAAAEAHALLGRLLASKDPTMAESHFRQAGEQDMLAVMQTIDAEPSPARQLTLLGIAFLQRQELALARAHLAEAAALRPDDPEILAYLAHTLDQLGETVSARELLDRAVELDKDSVLAAYFLGTHHRLVGNVETAQATLWEAMQRDPENAALRVEMAETFIDEGDYASAEEWYQGAIDVAPDRVDFHLALVHFYLDHLYRVAEGGIPAAQALVSLDPESAVAHDLLGWAYHLSGQQEEAAEALLRALALDPDLVSAHFHLGSLYFFTGRPTQAQEHLQRAANLDTSGYFRKRAEALLRDLD
jgi:tetratricopeptide (TPR) repeat protein